MARSLESELEGSHNELRKTQNETDLLTSQWRDTDEERRTQSSQIHTLQSEIEKKQIAIERSESGLRESEKRCEGERLQVPKLDTNMVEWCESGWLFIVGRRGDKIKEASRRET